MWNATSRLRESCGGKPGALTEDAPNFNTAPSATHLASTSEKPIHLRMAQ